MRSVYRVYKNLGETPLAALERLREREGIPADVPMTYAGRLDPMAEGLLLVLAGEECKRKEEYLSLSKVYTGHVLFGVGTDTGDLLGLPSVDAKSSMPNKEEIGRAAEELVGKRKQKYPKFSSKPVDGKPLWQHAREGKEVSRPTREIKVRTFSIRSTEAVTARVLLEEIEKRIACVSGDFRQAEIVTKWRNALATNEQEFLLADFEAEVSSGTYVRVLAEELGALLGTKACLFSLVRTGVGKYGFDEVV